MKKPDLAYYVSRFFESYLSGQKNVSENAVISYATTMTQLNAFFEDVKSIKTKRLRLEDMDAETIEEFLNWLEKERGVSVATRNQRLVAIRSFFEYVMKHAPVRMERASRILNIPYKKAPHTLVAYLTEDDMRALLAQPSCSDKTGFRDRVMLSVLYDTGARVQEFVDIRMKDVRLEKPAVITLHGKGNKIRSVPIMRASVKLLKAYLDSSKGNPGIDRGENPLFVNRNGEALSRWGISHIISKYVRQAKTEGKLHADFPVTPHTFRHSKAMHMLHAGVNLFYIRDFLGHVDVATTEIYARADTEMKRKAIEASCENLLPSDDLPDWNKDEGVMEFLESLRRPRK
jgi:site-specific recombinase XerD